MVFLFLNFTSLLTYVILDYPAPVETDLLKVGKIYLVIENKSSPPIVLNSGQK